MLHWVDGRTFRPRLRAAGQPPDAGLGDAPHVPRHARPRRSVPVAGILLVAGVVALGALWLSSHSSVTLLVEGEPSHHETHAPTVGAFLERAGVRLGPEDRVEPGLAAALQDGMRVEVVRAREVTLQLGDTQRQVVASALTVDELLADLGAGAMETRAGVRRRLVRPSRMSRVRDGMVVELTAPVALTLAYDGRVEETITTEPTVGRLLARAGVNPGPHDRVRPGRDEPLEHGMVVTVERVDVAVEVREEPLPYEVVETESQQLPRGERRVARAGQEGRVEVTEEVVIADGVEEERTVVGEEVLVEPVAQVVEVGTAAPPTVTSQPDQQVTAAGGAGGEPAADPAETEAGGGAGGAGEETDPPAAGAEPGEGDVERGAASWYDNPHGAHGAAHPSLPHGTVVRVTNVANGRSVEVRIVDRGPFVAGRVIDLDREAFAELAPLSRGVIQVKVEW